MEKALAKLCTNYTRTREGTLQFALRLLTGSPSRNYDVQQFDHDSLFDEILKADQLNYVLTTNASKDATGEAKALEEDGLVDHHVYSLIAAFRLPNARLLKLRNPWGRFEWKGPWSD